MEDLYLYGIVASIRRFPEFKDCAIAYQDGVQSRLIAPATNGDCGGVVLIIEKTMIAGPQLTSEVRGLSGPLGPHPAAAPPEFVANSSRLAAELTGTVIGCSFAVISAVGAAGGVAGEVPTGGASTILVLASWIGLRAGAVECLNGLVRVGTILATPDSDSLTQWDENIGYSTVALVVDAIGVCASVVSLPFALRNLFAILQRQRRFAALGLSFQRLKSLARLERMQVLKAAFEDAARTSEGRAAMMAAGRAANISEGTFEGASLTIRKGEKVARIISEETIRRLQFSLMDSFTSLGGITLSGSQSSMTGGASGSVRWLIHIVDAGAIDG